MIELIKKLFQGETQSKKLLGIIEKLKQSEEMNKPIETIRIGFEEWKV